MATGRTAVTLTAGILVGALSAGGVAVATSTAGTRVNFCALKTTGAVRLASKCHTKTEKAVKLGQVGPRGLTGKTGAAGPQGATGSTGATGLTGPSDVYSWAYYVNSGSPAPALDGSQSATLFTLPAGTYVISTHVSAYGAGSSTEPYIYCQPIITSPGGVSTDLPAVYAGLYPTSGFAVSSGADAEVFTVTTSSAAVSETCQKVGGQPVTFAAESVQAQRVGALHATGYSPYTVMQPAAQPNTAGPAAAGH